MGNIWKTGEDYCPQQANPHHIYLTVGGDHVEYPHKVSTPNANLFTSKLLINSVVSTPGAKFMTADIISLNLNMLLDKYEYMKLKYGIVPDEIK
eukprot:14620909-Ditylum_brightwellii.AAC.1